VTSRGKPQEKKGREKKTPFLVWPGKGGEDARVAHSRELPNEEGARGGGKWKRGKKGGERYIPFHP